LQKNVQVSIIDLESGVEKKEVNMKSVELKTLSSRQKVCRVNAGSTKLSVKSVKLNNKK